MRKRDVLKLERELSKFVPELSIAGSLLALSPKKPVLRAVAFDSSAFDQTSFSATAFLLPLCVPTEHLYFNFGYRVRHPRGGDRWNMSSPDLFNELSQALRRQALPFLSRVTSLLDFVEAAKSFSKANPHTLRAIAYSLAGAHRFAEAIDVLEELVKQLDTSMS